MAKVQIAGISYWTDQLFPEEFFIETNTRVPKEQTEWDDINKLAIQNNAKAKKILIYGICPDEYNKIIACKDAKIIWDTLQMVHEGTRVKKDKIDNLNTSISSFECWRRDHPRYAHKIHYHYERDLLTWRNHPNW